MYFLAHKIIPLIFSIPLINYFLLEFDTLKQISNIESFCDPQLSFSTVKIYLTEDPLVMSFTFYDFFPT